MGNTKRFLFVILMALVCSCVTTSISFHYPVDISAMCYKSKGDSKAAIVSTGKSLKEKSSLSVVKVPGQKNFSGYWAFWSPEWNQYICGSCEANPFIIKIASDPNNGTVKEVIVTHEHAHYWLISNFGDYGHNPIYAKFFFNWRDPYPASRSIVTNKNGKIVVIDLPPSEYP